MQELYSDKSFIVELNGQPVQLCSQLLKNGRELYSLCSDDRLTLHVRRSVFMVNCDEPLRNSLHLQMLRDTVVVYGDERRSKQEHLFTHQIYLNQLLPSPMFEGFVMADLAGLLLLHHGMYLKGVLNNLFVTTGYLRDYHYQKQKANAFYHIQAVNLPFQNFEFYWED